MKTDARVRYTKMRIKEAFFRCLRSKPVNKITVKELCEIAEINRATFYAHYADPFDLLEKTEEETLEEMRKFLSARRDSSERMLPLVLSGMSDPDGRQALLASPNGDPGFAAKITGLYQEIFIPGLAERLPGDTEEDRTLAYRFIAGGCGSMISRWMESENRISAEEMADKITEMCNRILEIP